jgi:flagellar biosynthesis protein FlhB
MAEQDQDQKTEAPTGKRLSEAREKGQLPVSRELSAWVLFLGILIVVGWLLEPMAVKMIGTLRFFIEMPHSMRLDDRGLQTVVFNTITQVALATGLIFAVLAFAAYIGTAIQTGFFVSPALLVPDITKLSPMAGFKRLFSTSALVEVFKSLGKLFMLGTVAFFALMPIALGIASYSQVPMLDALAYLYRQAVHLIAYLLLAFTLIAAGDLFYQRWQFMRNLRMTKAEVKDEFKQQEGDPMIKSRLRQIRIEKARKRMMAAVPKADVVVTNPTHYAVALQYDNKKMAAPTVVAKGVDRIAERIREVATENQVPLVSNPPLARVLYDTVDLDEQIPTQHYRAVAEVISYVYKLKKRIF